jgi:cell division protein FtsX
MGVIKYLASIPVVLSLLAGAYGAINYVSKLNNTVDKNSDTIALLKVELKNTDQNIHSEIDNIHQTYSERTGRNASNYTQAREELIREMTNMTTWVGRIEAIVNALQQGSYTVAKDAEVRALEDLIRANTDNIRDIGYDMKELERKLSGGY